MAQPQSQPPVPTPASAPAFSPPPGPQQSLSPAQSQPAFSLPPNKRPRLSPAPASQPQSPYNSSYAHSPGATGASTPGQTPTSAAASPQFTGIQLPISTPSAPSPGPGTPQNLIPTPTIAMPTPAATTTTNGHSPGLNLPHIQPQVPALPTPQGSAVSSPGPVQYTAATMAPIAPAPSPSAPSPAAVSNSMPPPARPLERQGKEFDYEPTDMLAGTGIDLRAEENYATEMLFNNDEASYGISQHPPGGKESFYGAGPMNQPSEQTDAQSQEDLVTQSAKKAWDAASRKLAQIRVQELNEPYLSVAALHKKLDKFSKEQGLQLHLDMKNPQQTQGRMRVADDFPQPRVEVTTKTLPDATVVHTTGSFIPHDAYLVDQLALLSIACKQRMRTLLEEASRVSVNRQATSHGHIPEEWSDVAAPLKGMGAVEEAPATEIDAAVDPESNSLKRTQAAAELEPNGAPTKLQRIDKNETISTVRDVARTERDWEELRLRKRNARKDGTTESVAPSRAGSVGPGTPGSTPAGDAATPKKEGLTKKEQRKNAAAKAAEASNHASQNLTSSMFVGKMGSVFGKKKYNWMTGGGRSGASTPQRSGTPGPGGNAAAAPAPAPESMPLTTDSRNRLGNWREDREKGRGVQLRDWIAALEADGLEHSALQGAYNSLDSSGPK